MLQQGVEPNQTREKDDAKGRATHYEYLLARFDRGFAVHIT